MPEQKQQKQARKSGTSTKPQGKAPRKPGAPSGNHGGELLSEVRSHNIKSLRWKKAETFATVIGTVALCVVGVFSVATSKQTAFVQLDNENRAVPLVALSQPKHGNAFVADWLNKCMVKTFDFYYKEMDEHLTRMKTECFNDNGYKSLISGLQRSGNYDAIKSKELFSALTLNKTPVVVRTKGDGTAPYKWLLQGEGILTLSTTSKDFPNPITITAVVERSSLLEDNVGLSIEKIILKNKSGL